MIGLDTNVLVRILTEDDPEQADRADALIKAHCSKRSPGWINRIVLCELVWVLEGVYHCPRSEVAGVLRQLLETADLEIEDHALAWSAAEIYRTTGIDFSDALLVTSNRDNGCEWTATFDRKASDLVDARLI